MEGGGGGGRGRALGDIGREHVGKGVVHMLHTW